MIAAGINGPSNFPRFVHKQRARKLRKRGVYLEHIGLPPGTFVWYESNDSWLHRSIARAISEAIRKRALRGPLYWNDEGLRMIGDATTKIMAEHGLLPPEMVGIGIPETSDEENRAAAEYFRDLWHE